MWRRIHERGYSRLVDPNRKWFANFTFRGRFGKVNIIQNLVVCTIKINTVIRIQKAEVKKLLQGSVALGAGGPDVRRELRRPIQLNEWSKAPVLTFFSRDMAKYNYTFPGEGAHELTGG